MRVHTSYGITIGSHFFISIFMRKTCWTFNMSSSKKSFNILMCVCLHIWYAFFCFKFIHTHIHTCGYSSSSSRHNCSSSIYKYYENVQQKKKFLAFEYLHHFQFTIVIDVSALSLYHTKTRCLWHFIFNRKNSLNSARNFNHKTISNTTLCMNKFAKSFQKKFFTFLFCFLK